MSKINIVLEGKYKDEKILYSKECLYVMVVLSHAIFLPTQ